MPRAKQFSVEDVLAKAVRRFSTHGYHATSVGIERYEATDQHYVKSHQPAWPHGQATGCALRRRPSPSKNRVPNGIRGEQVATWQRRVSGRSGQNGTAAGGVGTWCTFATSAAQGREHLAAQLGGPAFPAPTTRQMYRLPAAVALLMVLAVTSPAYPRGERRGPP